MKKNIEKVKIRSTASLPKLNSNPNSSVNVFERRGNTIYLEDETTLPFIRKAQERTKNKVVFKEYEKRCKTEPVKISVIDRDVENIKSNCQWYQKNHASNSCFGKLYNILERANREIDRIEKSIDLTGNRHLRKNMTKFSKDSESIAEPDVGRVSNPTKFSTKQDYCPNYKSINTTGVNFPMKDHVEKVDKKVDKQRFLFMNKCFCSTDDVFKLKPDIVLNRRDKNKRNNEMVVKTSVLNKEKLSTVKFKNIERYLKDYITNNNKFDMIVRNKAQEHPKFEASVEGVLNTLAVLNLNTAESQMAIEKHNNDDLEYPYCRYGNGITRNLKEGEEFVSAKSSGESVYTETGFNELNIPKDILDQVLQSKYLRKDLLSLHLLYK